MLILSAVFMALTFIVFAIYGLFAARVREHVIPRPRVLTLDAPHVCRGLRRARRAARDAGTLANNDNIFGEAT